MVSFDEMIKDLHGGEGTLADDGLSVDPKGVITINDKRQFILPANFNPVIGYEGDVNSQIITFDLPATVEGHELTECENKIIKWSNLQNGLEGRSKLEPVGDVTEGRQYLQWKVEPDVFVKAGTIQIAISFYDTDGEKIAFQWNTASFSGLSVAANASDIGFFEPAENEVLFISEETRRIVAPQGYNNVVCNYGDVGVSKIYFRTKRKIRGIDLLDSNTVVKIRCNLNGDIYVYNTPSENLKVTPYSTEVADVDGLVNIVWYVPAEITDNEQNYAGTFSIEVDFEESGKIWRTSTYNGFIIGSDVFQNAEDYLKNPDRYYVLDGELYHDNVAYTVIGGTYLVKKFTEGRDIPLRDREIVAEYDEDEVYKGLKVGVETEIDGESKVELQNAEIDVVRFVAQTLSNEQQTQVRNNLGLTSILNDKVDAITGKGLSENDYTTTEKNKLAGIAENANKYEHPEHTAYTSGLYKVTIDELGHISEAEKVTKTDITNLGIPDAGECVLFTEKGANNGVATLNENGKVPTSQLPSYVDDVLELGTKSSFPNPGETGKIYVAKDTNKTYRWSGTDYIEISASLALGITSNTAYRGDYGNTAYQHASKISGNPHQVTYKDLGLTTEKWTLIIEGQSDPVTKNIILLKEISDV